MAITFNDIALNLETKFVAKTVRKWWRWPLSVINTPLRPTSAQSYCRAPNWPRVPPLRPNQLYIPSGATRWSRVLLLVPEPTLEGFSESVGILRFDTYTPYPSRTVTATIVPGVPDDPETEPDESSEPIVTTWNLESPPKLRMHLLQPIPLSDHGESVRPPFVLPMVDDRYFWQGRLTTSNATTWEELLHDLVEDLAAGTGVAAEEYIQYQLQTDEGAWVISLADPNVSVPDPCFFRNGPIATAAALDLACWTLGLRCVPKDLSTDDDWTRYQLIDWGPRGTEYPKAAEIYDQQVAALKAEWANNMGGVTPIAPDNSDIPVAARFSFVGGYEREIAIENGNGLRRDAWSPAVAEMEGSFPMNAAPLTNLAVLWCDGWQEQLKTAFHWSWNGTPNLRFSGFEDYILYNLGHTPTNSVPWPITHHRSLPRNVGYEYIPFQLPEYAHRNCGVSTTGEPVPSTSGGCACCDCLDCIDLCDAPSPDVVEDCPGCPKGALKRYVAAVGLWEAWPELVNETGVITLNYDSECTWRSEELETDTGGTYQWVLHQAGGNSQIELEHVAGPDPVRITNGYWQVRWRSQQSDEGWSCLCHMGLKIESPDKTPEPRGLNCTICLSPRLTEASRPPGTCPPVEGVLPCIEPFTFPALLFTHGGENPLEFPFGFEGDTHVTFPMEWTINIEAPCEAIGGTSVISTTGLNGPAAITARLDYSAGTLRLNFQAPVGQTFREYTIDPLTLVLGDNIFTRQPLPPHVVDDSHLVAWPETVIVTLSDCRFGSTHPDYGYGCGGSSDTVDCGGAGCQYVAFDSEGTQGGPVGPWTWGGCIGGGGCPEGCTLPGPPEEPPTGAGDTYAVLCQPA